MSIKNVGNSIEERTNKSYGHKNNEKSSDYFIDNVRVRSNDEIHCFPIKFNKLIDFEDKNYLYNPFPN